MSNLKGFGLGFLVVLLFATMILFSIVILSKISIAQHLFTVRQTIYVYQNIDDRGTGISSLLLSEDGGVAMMEQMSSLLATSDNSMHDSVGSRIGSIFDAMDRDYKLTYTDPMSGDNVQFGDARCTEGQNYYFELPVPGARLGSTKTVARLILC